MAPEMCRAFLKSRYPSVFKNETEDFSLTGKVDVFAFGLVLQFMLEKTHTQMKFFTNGASSYTNVEDVNKLRLNIIIAVRYLLINAISFFLISFYVFLNCFILIFNEQRLKFYPFFHLYLFVPQVHYFDFNEPRLLCNCKWEMWVLTENCFKNSDVKFFLERGGGIVLKCYCISIRRPLEEFEYVSNYLIALNKLCN